MTPRADPPPEDPKGGERFSRIEVGEGGLRRAPPGPAGSCAFCGAFNEDGRRRCRGCFRRLAPVQRAENDTAPIADLVAGAKKEPWRLPAWIYDVPESQTMGLDRVTLVVLASLAVFLILLRLIGWWLFIRK